MIDDLRHTLDGKQPRMIVIGAHGRCGQGARSVADKLGLEVTCWDMEETKIGGPFPEIAEHDIFVNCVFVNNRIPPFLTRENLASDQRKLSVICDVSCDPTSDLNPLPFYSECSDFVKPCMRIIDGEAPLDLIAIDHLPSLLPAESSDDFSSQLLPSLLDIEDDTDGMWGRASDLFTQKTNSIK